MKLHYMLKVMQAVQTGCRDFFIDGIFLIDGQEFHCTASATNYLEAQGFTYDEAYDYVRML